MNAKQIRELMGLGIDGEMLVAVVTIFDVTQRDAKQKAADRSRRYRQRKRDERHVTVTRDDRDGDLLTSLSSSESMNPREERKEEKKVRARRKSSVTLRDDWKPTPAHFEAAERLKLSVATVYAKAEDMRLWAKSTDARKVDWDATFHGFLRRQAEKGHANGHGKSISDSFDRIIADAESRDRTLDLGPEDYSEGGFDFGKKAGR